MSKGTVNKVTLIGRLGADPEIRYTASGSAVCNVSLATTESYKGASGEYEDSTEWHRVTMWGKTAEAAGNYLGKGSRIYVEGRLQTRKWEDAQGIERYTTEVVVREMQFLDNKNENGNGGGQRSGRQSGPPQTSHGSQPGYDPEDDIPF